MQKIMFNDRYGLTKAVLDGQKTMTRRIVKIDSTNSPFESFSILPYNEESDRIVVRRLWHGSHNTSYHLTPKYKPGEVVAVAQAYRDIRDIIGDMHDGKSIKFMPGWNNKMFVRADLMPHQIRITDVRVERLQDITDEDCFLEGIERVYYGDEEWFKAYYAKDGCKCAPTPKEAFAALIDKVSGKGTWKSNPWVFVYEFELVM